LKTNAPIFIATRGSALALAQSNMIVAKCRAAFPNDAFELKIIKTTGDKLQTASLAQESKTLPKGLFTKELEVALLDGSADLAVHSLKDLPTELPTGLKLGAVGGEREDVRDVLIYRDADFLERERVNAEPRKASRRGFKPGMKVADFPPGSVIATSSTRRKAQLLVCNPTLKVPDIRGNVLTRVQKLMDNPDLDATVLALAGITRLHYGVLDNGKLEGPDVPPGVLATILETGVMLPCVGQGAIGIEIRDNDPRLEAVCAKLNHQPTLQCVIAERAFLSAMGGGCQSPVGAHAQIVNGELQMRVVSFIGERVRRAEGAAKVEDAAELGKRLAAELH
jgi:hydroxymethylbilane synthase